MQVTYKQVRAGTVGGTTKMDDDVSKRRPIIRLTEASAETLRSFRMLDIQTDRQLSSWLREAGVPDGALKANEPGPDFLLPEVDGRLVSSLELRRTDALIVTFGPHCAQPDYARSMRPPLVSALPAPVQLL